MIFRRLFKMAYSMGQRNLSSGPKDASGLIANATSHTAITLTWSNPE